MKVEMDDVCYKLHDLIEVIGIEKFVEVSRIYGGSRIYIPTYSKTTLLCRNREIMKSYNGFNADELSRRYGVSVTHIRRIVRENEDFDIQS